MKRIIDFFTGSPIKSAPQAVTFYSSIKQQEQTIDDLIVMSCHYNGFKREAAVRMLGNMGDPRAFSALLVRVNDWVSEVRIVAKESFIKLLTTENINEVIEHLPQIYHLLNCGRTEHVSLLESVDNFLKHRADPDFIIDGISSSEKLVARACLNLVLTHNLLPESDLTILGLKNSDVVVRLRCADLLKNLPLAVQKPLLKIAINDKFMPIRREAFQVQLTIAADDENIVLAKTMLFDRHSSIRTIAINYLNKRNPNISEEYISALESSTVAFKKCALWGIGHLSLKEHTDEVRRRLDSEFPSIRQQALVTLYKLNYELMKSLLLSSLLDKSVAVCKAASRFLAKSEFSLTLKDLSNVLKKAESTQLYSICLFLSRHINKWDRLIFIIHCHSLDLDDTDNELLQKEYVNWNLNFNNTGTQPSKEQLFELLYLYKTDREFIGDSLYNILSFTLRTNGMKIDG